MCYVSIFSLCFVRTFMLHTYSPSIKIPPISHFTSRNWSPIFRAHFRVQPSGWTLSLALSGLTYHSLPLYTASHQLHSFSTPLSLSNHPCSHLVKLSFAPSFPVFTQQLNFAQLCMTLHQLCTSFALLRFIFLSSPHFYRLHLGPWDQLAHHTASQITQPWIRTFWYMFGGCVVC